MENSIDNSRRNLILLKYLPQWFVALFALVYLSGYLIDYYYSTALGISENGGDLLKLKYVQVGLNFIVLVLIFAGPSLFDVFRLLGLFIHFSQTKAEVRSRSVRFFVSLFTVVYTTSIYSAFLFTPWHYFENNATRIHAVLLLIFAVQIIYIATIGLVERLEKKRGNKRRREANRKGKVRTEDWSAAKIVIALNSFDWVRIGLCCVLIAFTVYVDSYVFGGLRATLYECFYEKRGYVFFILCVLFGVLLYRAIGRIKAPPIPFVQYLLVMAGSLLVIFYLALISYAYFIFPYIPSVKGGADFTNAALVSVTFKNTVGVSGPVQIQNNVIYVYSSATSAYFAIPSQGSSPCNWRRRENSPKLISIQQSAIQKIDIGIIKPSC
jgi:hypothetical protein